ncbi:MAG: hypothetical protein ACLS43_05070 [Evtepia gabavorous]
MAVAVTFHPACAQAAPADAPPAGPAAVPYQRRKSLSERPSQQGGCSARRRPCAEAMAEARAA